MKNSSASHQRIHLLDDLWLIQNKERHLSIDSLQALAKKYDMSLVEVEGVASFYHFFHQRPAGRYTIYVNDSLLAELNGYAAIVKAFEEATGATLGKTDPSGTFGLFTTSCIGLSDLEPSALINFLPFTRLTPQKAKAIIWQLKRGERLENLADRVPPNIRQVLPEERAFLLRPFEMGKALEKLQQLGREAALEIVERSGLRGMGGAFFPAGRKWRLCAQQPATPKYIVCNADEGEPGTFKDRLLLRYLPEMVIEGMIFAGYCTGASEGIIYLRAEYRWLLSHLQEAIARYREAGWIGSPAPFREEFHFDIRIQLGAGAYVCGEETALLHSLEGERGEPRVRTHFPVEKGFLGQPTVVNNVETFAAAARLLEQGVNFFRTLGTEKMPGTRLFSVSGDCLRPGVYEMEWGTTLGQLLDWCGAEKPFAVQVSGPSGSLIRAADRHRRFDSGDLLCGGAVSIFNEQRNLLKILRNYADFFRRESCGVCTPCRAGNYVFFRKLEKLDKGLGTPEDADQIRDWSAIMRQTSRCGLGRTATNALLTAMDQFPDHFACYFGMPGACSNLPFELDRAVEDYRKTVKS